MKRSSSTPNLRPPCPFSSVVEGRRGKRVELIRVVVSCIRPHAYVRRILHFSLNLPFSPCVHMDIHIHTVGFFILTLGLVLAILGLREQTVCVSISSGAILSLFEALQAFKPLLRCVE